IAVSLVGLSMMEASDSAPTGRTDMKRARWQSRRDWVMLPVLFLAGCAGVGPQSLPKDPLFIQQRPIQGKSTGAVPMRMVAVDPAPPPLPVAMTNRRSYARNRTAALPDHVH